LPGGRRQAFAVSGLTVLEVYVANPEDMDKLGGVMCVEVDRLGGLVRKTAQQVSQLPDVVPKVALRRRLQRLQGRNEPRDQREIEQQLRKAFPSARISVKRVLGTGCMGEVSEVLVHGVIDGRELPVGTKFAAKTANPEQRRLFEEDFEIFANLKDAMSIPLKCLRQINQKTAVELEAVVNKITDMARNGDLVSSVRNGFDMRVEHELSCRGANVLRHVGREVFFAPQMYAVSEDALLMQLVEGRLLEHEAPPDFVRNLIGLYVRMLHQGYLHQDPHPANIIVLPRSADTIEHKVALIDWGEVVEVPSLHQEDIIVLFRTVVAGRWMGREHDTLRELFQRLGVEVKPDTVVQEKAYMDLANMLNLVQGVQGDSEVNTATLVGATAFQAPGWFEAWQKATNALVISLQAAGASPETVGVELRRELGIPTVAS